MPAKRYTKDELKAAVTKWADETGLPAEDRPAFLKSLDHDGFAAKLGEAILMRSDYSRLLDQEIKPAKELYDSKYNELVNTWYPGVKRAHDEAVTAKTAADRRIAQFKTRFGDIDDVEDQGDGTVRTPTGDVLRKADVEKLLAEARASAKAEAINESVSITLLVQKLAADHWREFGEVLDTDPLVQAVKSQRDKGNQEYSLRSAYDDSFGPKLEEKRASAAQKKIDDAVTAARVDERSKMRSTPAVVADDGSVGPFAAQNFATAKPKVMSEAELEADFVRGMNEDERASTAATTSTA